MALINQNSIIGVTSITSPGASNVLTVHTNDTTERLRVTANGLSFSGTNASLDTSGNATFNGNVSIGGTLTYEDVTNIDAVGVITARAGINATGDITFGTNSKAKLFENGTQSGVQATNSGSSAHLMTHDGNEDIHVDPSGYIKVEVAGSERLRITSAGSVGIGTDNPSSLLHIRGTTGKLTVEDTNGAPTIEMKNVGTNSSNDGMGGFTFTNTGYNGASGIAARTASNGSGAILQFLSGTAAEKMRLDSSGRLLLGTTDAGGNNTANHLVVSNNSSASDQAGISIRGGTSGRSQIFFSDGISGQDEYRGMLRYEHSDNSMQFRTNATERLRITSGGLLDVSGGIHVTENVTPTSGRGIEIFEAGTGVGQISSYNRDNSSWDELRLKGSEIAFYTGTSNGLGFYLQSTQSTLYGTSDGILNLDTTDGRGSFIRFKENGSTKAWVGCAEGMGGGTSSPDQDDLGLRATGNILFSSNGSERVRITEGGLLQIGTSTTSSFPDRLLSVGHHTRASSYIDIRSATVGALLFADGTSGNTAYRGQVEYNHGDDSMRLWTAAGERLRITSTGLVGVNDTTAGWAEALQISSLASYGQYGVAIKIQNNSGYLMRFANATNICGSVSSSGGNSTSYNTSWSDSRRKKNFENWNEEVLPLFKTLEPKKFNFTHEDDETEKTKGYVAQDVVNKFPEAYPLLDDSEVDDQRYMFNPSGMTVYLMKALQEEIAKREALEARIAALEG